MKQQYPFLQLPVSFDAQTLADEVLAIDESEWLPHPNGLPGNTALTLITTEGLAESNALYGPMLPTRHLLRCHYLMQVLGSIGGLYWSFHKDLPTGAAIVCALGIALLVAGAVSKLRRA